MARTPIAAKNTQDPTYSEGYVCNQSPDTIDSILGGEDGFRSLIDLTSRTPSHIRFGDIEPETNQLALVPLATCQIAEQETKLREALAVIRYLEEQMRNLQKPKDALLDIPQHVRIIAHLNGGRSITGIDLGGATALEESTRIGLAIVDSHQIVTAPVSIVMPETEIAPLNVTADRRVPVSKYFSVVITSTDIAKDKSVDNLEMLEKALRASNLLSLVDGSRKRPTHTADNTSGYIAEAIVHTVDSDGIPSYIVIAADDCYKYYDETIITFTFLMSMVHKDMHHMLLDCSVNPDWIFLPN